MLGALQETEIEDILKNSLVGRIGCHADGETYVVPISYGYDGHYVYCHALEGKKTEMMRKNPRICFLVDEMKDMANWKSVLVQGKYEELTESEQRDHAIKILLNRFLPIISSETTHLGKDWPFHPDNSDEIDGIIFRIDIAKKTGRFENSTESPELPG